MMSHTILVVHVSAYECSACNIIKNLRSFSFFPLIQEWLLSVTRDDIANICAQSTG